MSGIRKAIVVMALLMVVPVTVVAVPLHDFDCQDCHGTSMPLSSTLSNVCLSCHSAPNPVTKTDGSQATPTGIINAGDASNALGHSPAPSRQNSHFWGGGDTAPEAGALPASNPLFSLRNNYSNGTVACSRCHHPHEDGTLNPSLLKLPPYVDRYGTGPWTADDMCLDCHRGWNDAASHGVVTHPIGVTYDGGAPGFKPAPDNSNVTNGNVNLVNGKVSCTSCHGVHWTDSDASTPDGEGIYNTGDGLMLKHNGPSKEAGDTSICQACHDYQGHGVGSATSMGCLVCHGGHEYDPGGQPNIFMLKKQITLTVDPDTGADISSNPITVNLDYTTYPPPANYDDDSGAGNGSLCLSCHTLPGTHSPSATCADCHDHKNGVQPNCGSCHGYPPVLDADGSVTSGGYAHSVTNTTNNYSTSGVYKAENLTPHARHAGGGSNYSIGCINCHGDGSGDLTDVPANGNHDAGTFQQVLDTAIGALPALTTNNGTLTPIYAEASPGSCNAVYCHSNGDPRDGAIAFPASDPIWDGGSGTISTCDVCHGNTSATMISRGNSAVHQAHLGNGTLSLGKTYSCAVCHSATASNSTTLSSLTRHVDGTKDVVSGITNAGLDASVSAEFAFASGAGTCSTVYCHSDGKGNYAITADWDGVTATCTFCHNNGTDDGVLVNAAPNSGNHAKHLGISGVTCATCHGANDGSHAGHLDGKITVPAQAICNTCHGATVSGTGVDSEPVWGDSASVSCQICHMGTTADLSVAGYGSAPDKTDFGTYGHGGVAAFNTAHPEGCEACHALTADHIGGAASSMLTGGAIANDTFCKNCHAQESHYNDSYNPVGTSTSGDACAICHNPHGDGVQAAGNGDAMVIVGSGFINRANASSYFNGSNNGVCQVCHSPASLNHYNNAGTDGHNSTTACNVCHSHTSVPSFKGGACYSCHGDAVAEYWPQNAGNDRTTDAVSDFNDAGRHQKHMEVLASTVYSETLAQLITDNANGTADTKQKALCSYCHIVGDSDHASLNNGFAEVFPAGGSKSLWGAVDGDAAFSGTDYNSCSAVDCHKGKDTGTGTYGWYDAGTSACIMCHADITVATAGTTGGTHNDHLTADTNYGKVIVCATCHDGSTDWAGNTKPVANHINGTLDISGTVSLSYTPATGCATNDCHNDGNGSTPNNNSYPWGTDIVGTNCDLCHTAPPQNAKHQKHIDNTVFVPSGCTNCHTAETAATHIDGTKDTGAQVTSYDNVNFTCANACHLTGNGDWAADGSGTLACADCHGSGKNTSLISASGELLDRGWPPSTETAHAPHVGNTSYVSANCVDCHNNNTTGHSAIDGTATSPTLGAKISVYDGVTGTCTNTCHAGNADFTDSNPAPACSDCHSGTYIGGSPSSGLHATTNAMAHDVDFTASHYTCTDCHQSTPTNQHINGTGPTAFGAGGITYNFNSTNIASYSASGCAANCHTDGADWNRKWNGVTDLQPTTAMNPGDAVCANCHGDFANGWNLSGGATSTIHTNPYTGNDATYAASHAGNPDALADTGNHGTCQTCHGWGDAAYDGTPGHQDGSITMNGPIGTGAGYDDSTGGCTAACHGSEYVMNTNSGWGANYADFGTGDCAGCHTGNGVTYGDPGDLALHTAHNVSPYVDLTTTNGTYNIANSATYDDCATCHGHNGTAGHNNGTVEFSGAITSASNYTFTTTAANEFTSDNCTNTCHDNDSGDWNNNNLGADSCVDCHNNTKLLGNAAGNAYPPTSNQHSPHIANTALFPSGTNCDLCHGSGAVSGTHTGHKNKGTNIDLAGSISSYTTGDCTNSCHTSPTDAWTLGATLSCSDCHTGAYIGGNYAATGQHSVHNQTTPASYTAAAARTSNAGAYDFNCANCHGNTAGNHKNGSVQVDASVNYSGGNCSNNNCHQDGNGGAAAVTASWSSGWVSDPTTDTCDNCHGNSPTSGAHSVHAVGIHSEDIYTGTTGLLTPNASSPSAHGNATTSTVINCSTCHNNTVDSWYNAYGTECSSCHDISNTSLGDNALAIATYDNHVNGIKDVAFMNIAVKSKAQLRDNLADAPEVGGNWNRTIAYKGSGDYDQASSNLTADDYTDSTCTTACHNNIDVTWQVPANDCTVCHIKLPK